MPRERITPEQATHALNQTFKMFEIGQAGSKREDGTIITAQDVVNSYLQHLKSQRDTVKAYQQSGRELDHREALALLLNDNEIPTYQATKIGTLWEITHPGDPQEKLDYFVKLLADPDRIYERYKVVVGMIRNNQGSNKDEESLTDLDGHNYAVRTNTFFDPDGNRLAQHIERLPSPHEYYKRGEEIPLREFRLHGDNGKIELAQIGMSIATFDGKIYDLSKNNRGLTFDTRFNLQIGKKHYQYKEGQPPKISPRVAENTLRALHIIS